MNIRVLRYFIAVVNEKNISNAAKTLYITQPTLSRQLKELEEELGVKLFERGKKEIQLTEDGKFLYSRASEIIALVDKTVENINSAEAITGDIYIGCGETRAMKIIASTIRLLHSVYPNIKVHLFSSTGEEIANKMEKGLLDFGIIIGPVNERNFNYIKLPYEDIWGILTTKNGFFKNHNFITSDDLIGVPLLSSKHIMINQDISRWIGENIEKYNFSGSYSLIYNASFLVEENIGHALCFDGLFNTEGTNLKFIPLSPELRTGVSLIWKKNQRLSKAAHKLLEFMRKSIVSKK